MRTRNRTLLVLFAVLFLATLSQPAAAAFSWFDWTTGSPQSVGSLIENPPVLTLQTGQDIVSAFYAADADYRFFRMDLKGAPGTGTGSNGFAPLYSILIGGSGSLNTFALSNPFPPPSLILASGGSAGLGAIFARQTGATLEWAVERDKLPDTFSWYGLTANLSGGAVSGIFDITAPALVTPIPSAALLLGTGIVGLVGLRRRSFRKA